MSENRAQEQVHPLPESYNYRDAYTLGDQESGTPQSKEFRKKKRVKCLAYILAFAVFQTGVILIFTQTVMKIRTPKFRVRNATFGNFEVFKKKKTTNMNCTVAIGLADRTVREINCQ